MDHFHDPECKGVLKDADSQFEKKNVSCGDHIRIFVKVSDGKLLDAKFEGDGCAISQATASILLSEVIGLDTKKILEMDAKSIQELIEMQLSPVRLKCALLSLEVLQEAIKQV